MRHNWDVVPPISFGPMSFAGNERIGSKGFFGTGWRKRFLWAFLWLCFLRAAAWLPYSTLSVSSVSASWR